VAKNGSAYLSSIRDERTIYIDGRLAADVTQDPSFARATASVARLYDYQADPAHLAEMTFRSPTSGEQVNRAWQLPRNMTELVQRRRALEQWAALSCGMFGRSPDHVASTLAGFRMGLSRFRAYEPARAAALEDYFTYARDNDLFLSYVIINPQADKARSAREQPDAQLVASIVDEDSQGITIRGAKMLATGGVMANELLVSGFQALQPGDEAYAFTATVPLSAKGLTLMSRRSYEHSASSAFDYPLSVRFDENDAVVYFEDVKIPWDRVFVCRDLKMAQAQWHETRAHVFHNYQCMIRLTVKLRFLLGLARKIAETNNIINYPQVRDSLGLLAARVNNIEALVVAMEASGEFFEGFYVPNRSMLCTAQVIAQITYPEIVEGIRTLAGGGLIMLPASIDDFANPRSRDIIQKTQRSPVATPVERVKLMKLAWDAVGSEFGARHLQYEMFYSGATYVTRGNAFRFFDWNAVKSVVEEFMDSYDLPAERKLESAAE
jgi:4-hydroxyphenylacetate 3-monooxygenase